MRRIIAIRVEQAGRDDGSPSSHSSAGAASTSSNSASSKHDEREDQRRARQPREYRRSRSASQRGRGGGCTGVGQHRLGQRAGGYWLHGRGQHLARVQPPRPACAARARAP